MLLPLHDLHVQAGAEFDFENGWTAPRRYGKVQAEYAALREAAGLVDLSDRETLAVTGPDRVDFLQGQLTNDVKALTPGQGCYSLFCNIKGQVLADFGVLALEDAFLLDLPPGRLGPVKQTLEKFCITEQVEFEDVSLRYGRIGVFGPRAKEAIAAVSAGGAPCALDPSHHNEWVATTPDGDIMLRLVGPPDGTYGYYIFVARENLAPLWAALTTTGTAHGIIPCGRDALTIVQVEDARPQFGREIDEDTNAIELKLYPAISYTKGCFLGQEAIARMTYRGKPAKELAGLVINGNVPPTPGDELIGVQADGGDKDAGSVRAAVVSPTLGKPIALALVRRAFTEPGTTLRIHHGGGELTATVHALPFVGEPRPDGPDAAPKV